MPQSQIFNVASMSFNAIHKNEILVKQLEFTVWNVVTLNIKTPELFAYSVILLLFFCHLPFFPQNTNSTVSNSPSMQRLLLITLVG